MGSCQSSSTRLAHLLSRLYALDMSATSQRGDGGNDLLAGSGPIAPSIVQKRSHPHGICVCHVPNFAHHEARGVRRRYKRTTHGFEMCTVGSTLQD